MDKSYIIKKIIKLSLVLVVLVALYVIGCNAVHGETSPDVTPIAPLPEYTPEPTFEPVSDEPATGSPPIFYMPPHNSAIYVRWYGSWLTANGSPLYLYDDGKTGSVPPNYVSHSYTSGDVCDIQFVPDMNGSLVPYDGSYNIDFYINMNSSPIHDFQNYSQYKIWVNIDSFAIHDKNDASIRLDYDIVFTVKLSGYNEDGEYTSASFQSVYDRKSFKKGILEVECNAASYFTELTRADCSISFECELPAVYTAPRDSSWYITARSLSISDRLFMGQLGTVLQTMFLPSTETLEAFVNSKFDTSSPGSGWDSAFGMIFDALTVISDPYKITGSTKLTIPELSINIDGNRAYKYFNGGWFDLADWSYNFGGSSFNGSEHAKTFYSWAKTISSVLITIDFVALVFDIVLSFMNASHWNRFTYLEEDGYDRAQQRKERGKRKK